MSPTSPLPFTPLLLPRRPGRLSECLRIALWLVAFLVLSGLQPGAAAAAARDSSAPSVEERVKAASLYKFISYVDWPPRVFETPEAPYVVGVVGAEAIAKALRTIAGARRLNHRPMLIKEIRAGDSLNGVHVLFVGKKESARLQHWLHLVQSQPVLTVTEQPDALAYGSMINFRIAEERVRFEVGLEPVEKSALSISSRMLSVALTVVKAPAP